MSYLLDLPVPPPIGNKRVYGMLLRSGFKRNRFLLIVRKCEGGKLFESGSFQVRNLTVLEAS